MSVAIITKMHAIGCKQIAYGNNREGIVDFHYFLSVQLFVVSTQIVIIRDIHTPVIYLY